MIPMKNVNFILGSEEIDKSPMQVYADEVCAFIAEVSAKLMQSPLVRQYPDLSALAFWGRKKNIEKLKNDFGDRFGWLGRGLCFHIAPSNVPINFAFTYLFGLLAGNANIVRLPSKEFPQVEAMCQVFKEVLKNYPEIEKRTAFVKYPRDDEITAEFCKMADVRMIWGGDETISSIKQMPAKPRCIDVAFADRYSLALIDANAILSASAEDIKKLADNFYNDTYLMDQNACSSPQIILWQNDNPQAREIFWKAVYNVAKQKYVLQDASAVDKYTLMCEEAINNPNFASCSREENLLYREELSKLDADIINHRGKSGYFYEYALQDLDELCKVVTEKFQTITYFGVDVKILYDRLIATNVRGVDRIVPIGKAMDIDVIWDGFDLVRVIARIMKVD